MNLGDMTDYYQEVGDAYILVIQRIKDANYQLELKLKTLK